MVLRAAGLDDEKPVRFGRVRTEAACATLRTEAMCETAGPGFRLKSVIFKENLAVSVKAPVAKKARVVKKSHRRLRPFAWD
jgi:hypothetical protein